MIELAENQTVETPIVKPVVKQRNLYIDKSSIEIKHGFLTYTDDELNLEIPIKFNPFTGEELKTKFKVCIECSYNGRVISQEFEEFDYEDFDDMSNEEIVDQIQRDYDVYIDINDVCVSGTFSINNKYENHEYDLSDVDLSYYPMMDTFQDFIRDNIEVTVYFVE